MSALQRPLVDGLVARRIARDRQESAEAALNAYFTAHVAAGARGPLFVAAHPVASVRAGRALLRLPVLTAAPTPTVEGRAVREGLSRPLDAIRTDLQAATSVLDVPERPADYLLGSSRQTLRRKVRRAERLGVRWERVEDRAERARLKLLAEAVERDTAPDRFSGEQPQLEAFLDHGLWLAAYSAAGEPILLSVTPVDGEWAVLRYFRTLRDGEEASVARYLVTAALVQQLAERGVRRLADSWSPVVLPNGLRHFQRMLGFRIVRVRLERSADRRRSEGRGRSLPIP